MKYFNGSAGGGAPGSGLPGKVWVFICEDKVTTREQIAVVESFLKDDTGLKDPMALIVKIDDKQLVWVVPYQIQFCEFRINLYVATWEAYGIFYVAASIIFPWAHVKQNDFAHISIEQGLFCWVWP